MSKIIFVPQYPSRLRYQEWWFDEFRLQFEKNKLCITLGEKYLENKSSIRSDIKMFSPINEAIKLEIKQIQEYLDLEIEEDDILFISDISFPGIFPSLLYHKRPKKIFAYCHGTSLNLYDYYEKDRLSKWQVEEGILKLFDTVYVGSEYHSKKLGIKNCKVIGLPIPFIPFFSKLKSQDKLYDVISVARPCIQKVSEEIEKEVGKTYPIIRKEFDFWSDYYQFLSDGKILLISSKEDTFNYSIMEATLCGCIPLAPNRCSYPELLPEDYIYKNIDDLKEKISYYTIHYDKVPTLLNINLCKNFFNNILEDILIC